MKKRILVFGAGVIGSVYGGLLAKSGHDVTLLARNRRLSELKGNGLLLNRVDRKNPERIETEIIDSAEINYNYYDFVFVTVRSDQVKEALPALSKINSSCFVFMVNNPSGYTEWINLLGYERVLPAFPGIGGKIENGIVYYEIVSKFVQPTTMGELHGKNTSRLNDLSVILKKAGFHVSVSKNMESWQKSHVAMIAPLGNVIYYDGGNNYSVAGNKKAIKQMNLALKENFFFLKKTGIGIEPFRLNIFLFMPLFMLNLVMKYIYNSKWAETVISNHALNAKPEMQLISDEFIKLADIYGYKLNEFKKLTKFL